MTRFFIFNFELGSWKGGGAQNIKKLILRDINKNFIFKEWRLEAY